MQVTTVWPKGGPEIILSENSDNYCECYFHVDKGIFSSTLSAKGSYVVFAWGASGPELRNENSVYVCGCDGISITQGERVSLQYNMDIQIGKYRFQTEVSTYETLKKELVKGFCSASSADEFPQLDSLLGEQSYYSGSQDEIHMLAQDGVSEDNLRLLGYEYKEYLQWRDQKREFRPQSIDHRVSLPANDKYLESVVNHVKKKTVTECIFGKASLIDMVITEIDTEEQVNDDDEGFVDILYLLAPDYVPRKEKKILSHIVYHELHKPGLNSYL